jgi:hypothetical protein
MGTCVFNTTDLKRCVQHALSAPEWQMPFAEDETPTPALLFVHDNGVYLMSNGNPRDLRDTDSGHAYVVHAATTKPGVDEDWWENASDLVGGDDFVEILPVTQQWLEDCDLFEECYVTVEGNRLEAGFRRRRAPALAAV